MSTDLLVCIGGTPLLKKTVVVDPGFVPADISVDSLKKFVWPIVHHSIYFRFECSNIEEKRD